MAESEGGHEGEHDAPRVDAVLRVASGEITFWKRLAIRVLVGAFATVAILAILGAIAIVIVLGRFDSQQDILRQQSDLSAASDCNRRLQAELNDVQGITTQAFLSGNIAYFNELQTYRQSVTNLQRNIGVGKACPAIPARPAPPDPPPG